MEFFCNGTAFVRIINTVHDCEHVFYKYEKKWLKIFAKKELLLL